MRPGKPYGILIDHAGAVFRHGFPDEDTEWTLEGDTDARFAAKHAAGNTEQAKYCAACEIAYHGKAACPQCGKKPTARPKSIFDPPPQLARNELLTEAERGQVAVECSRDRQIATWYACLATAKKRNGSFGMAAAIYQRKYKSWPPRDFPHLPRGGQWKSKVQDVYPNLGHRGSRQ
jgi:hypothetical protein